MMRTTQLNPGFQCHYPYSIECSSKCFVTESSLSFSFANELKEISLNSVFNPLSYQVDFTELDTKFAEALKNETIAYALENSVGKYNKLGQAYLSHVIPQYQSTPTDYYFVSAPGKTVHFFYENIAHNDKAIRMEWYEQDALSDHSNKKLTSFLYVSKRETIFVPAPKNKNDDIALYRGYKYIYSTLRAQCSYQLTRKIADDVLTVRTLGEISPDGINLPRQEVFSKLENAKFHIYFLKVFFKNGTFVNLRHTTQPHFGFFSKTYYWLKNQIFSQEPDNTKDLCNDVKNLLK